MTRPSLVLTILVATIIACRAPLEWEVGSAIAGGAGRSHEGESGSGGEFAAEGFGGMNCGTCELGTVCIDSGGGQACEYAEPSPWLVFESGTLQGPFSVMIVPLAHAALGVSHTLATLPDEFQFVMFKEWSPSGKILIFDEMLTNFDDIWSNRLMWTEFGRGVPAPATPIPNLPLPGDYFLDDWDPETDAALVHSDDEAFVVRFRNGKAIAELAVTSEEEYSVAICRGAETVVYSTRESTFLVPLASGRSEHAGEHIEIGTWVNMSGDRRSLAVVREDPASGGSQLFVGTCDLTGMQYPLLESTGSVVLDWSPDSNHLAVLDDDEGSEGVKQLFIFEVSLPGEKRIFSQRGIEQVRWSPDGQSLVLEHKTGDRSIMRLDSLQPELLPIGTKDSRNHRWCGRHLIMDAYAEEGGDELVLALEPGVDARPRPLFGDSSDEITNVECNQEAEQLAYVRRTAKEVETLEVLDLVTHESHTLYEADTGGTIRVFEFPDSFRGLTAVIYDASNIESRLVWMRMAGAVWQRELTFEAADFPTFQP
jgi:hypothetical protein